MELNELKEKIIGLDLVDAKKIYKKIRVTKKDGEAYFVTADFIEDRLNVEVENGKISNVKGFN